MKRKRGKKLQSIAGCLLLLVTEFGYTRGSHLWWPRGFDPLCSSQTEWTKNPWLAKMGDGMNTNSIIPTNIGFLLDFTQSG